MKSLDTEMKEILNEFRDSGLSWRTLTNRKSDALLGAICQGEIFLTDAEYHCEWLEDEDWENENRRFDEQWKLKFVITPHQANGCSVWMDAPSLEAVTRALRVATLIQRPFEWPARMRDHPLYRRRMGKYD